jgi:hypothetical protein
MKAWQKFAGFILGLVVVFVAAIGVGAWLGPDGGDVTAPAAQSHDTTHTAADDESAVELPGGLMSTDNGYTLELQQTRMHAAKNAPLRFRIVDSRGAAVTRDSENHEKQLHLIVVRRDLVGFQHVHPVMESDGTWSVPVDLSRAGDYRIFADFVPDGGEDMTLGADVYVAGEYAPRRLPVAATTTTVDGYTVTLSGTPRANESSILTLSVSRDGNPVTDLQPYLAAYGHLVALRASDLAYLHVHPIGEPGDGTTLAGPEIKFATMVPSSGDYRLFLDFKHAGVVRTAEFPVSAESVEATAPTQALTEPAPAGHGH